MLLPAIPLDSAMLVSDALVLLAWHGLWEDPTHPAAADYIEEHRARVASPTRPAPSFTDAARRLRKSPSRMGVAIRRQWYGQILWYARPAEFVLRQLLQASPEDSVLNALNLHETDSQPTITVASAQGAAEGVVVDQGQAVAVSLVTADAPPRRSRRTRSPGSQGAASRGTGGGPVPESVRASAWPLLEAPDHAAAQIPFTVTVGFAAEQQPGVVGGQVAFAAPPGAESVDLTVELVASGVDAPDGWTRPLKVAVADPTAARATFTLVGRAPANTEPVHLTTLEVRYVLNGAVVGTAARPLEIRAAGYVPPDGAASRGNSWLAQPTAASDIVLEAAAEAPDLTIEIFKSNDLTGSYACRLYSPHKVPLATPPDINFGKDSSTFARAIVDEIRAYASDAAVDNLLRSWGEAVADKLPDAAHAAIYAVAEITKPDPPAVLIVSADPYVPWEIAVLDPPLNAEFPPFLGAQTLLGRWLRDGPAEDARAAPVTGTSPAAHAPRLRVRKPPAQPPGSIRVRHLAVMAGVYKLESGQKALPEAEAEAKSLIQDYDAVALSATTQSLKQLVDATLSHGLPPQAIGGVGAVHFAGHGDFNPANPDASVMLLSNGMPMPSAIFRSAKYGGNQQPLIFLNACMIGIGGQLLGDMGGFPGNCLKGGFGGVVAALWEVNDKVAREIALEFWQRVLPRDGSQPEPVANVLRDLRAQYDHDSPVPSYLSYVYYGHPRLTLQRIT